jgi:dihydrofolate reductase
MTARRILRYQVASSLDGFIAGPKGEFDWILMDPEIDFGALLARFDTLLMGRRTWETAAAMHGGGKPFGMETYVVSTTLDPAAQRAVHVIREDIAARVRELKEREGKEIWLYGGGALCASLLDAGLVDAIELAVIPVVLGAGVPVVAPTRSRHSLKLVSQRVFSKTGTLLLTYEVEAAKQPPRSKRR